MRSASVASCERDAQEHPLVRIERGFPQLFAVHLAEALEALDLDALLGDAVNAGRICATPAMSSVFVSFTSA
jgi:hypothetical protein